MVKVEDIGCIKPEKVWRSFEVEFSLVRVRIEVDGGSIEELMKFGGTKFSIFYFVFIPRTGLSCIRVAIKQRGTCFLI